MNIIEAEFADRRSKLERKLRQRAIEVGKEADFLAAEYPDLVAPLRAAQDAMLAAARQVDATLPPPHKRREAEAVVAIHADAMKNRA